MQSSQVKFPLKNVNYINNEKTYKLIIHDDIKIIVQVTGYGCDTINLSTSHTWYNLKPFYVTIKL